MKFLNYHGECPNILHAQGKSKTTNDVILTEILNSNLSLNIPNDLTIVSIWSDADRCILAKQLEMYNIPVINAYIDNGQCWNNVYKINCILECLQTITTDKVLILDGYDTVVLTFDNIVQKFEQTGYRVLYNATKHNFPNIDIDIIPTRPLLGEYCYFNAGCCIGYTADVKKFYEKCQKYIHIENPKMSEQMVLRYAFAEHSNNILDKNIFIDYGCTIFQTLGSSVINYIGNNTCKIY